MIDPNSIPIEQLQGSQYVPPQPEILQQLHRIMADRDPDLLAMANLVASDVGLASAVLKTINSAYFGMRQHVADILQAAVLLGAGALINLVTGYELQRAIQGNTCLQLGRFWDTAADTALACVQISRECALEIPTEELYTLGLFHDCGIAIMAQSRQDYRDTLVEINGDYQRSPTQIEQDYYGIDHSILGYAVAVTWGLPQRISEAILQNHERDLWQVSDGNRLKSMVAVLKWAENLVDLTRRQCENTDWAHHRHGALQALELDTAMADEMAPRICLALQQERG